MIIKDNYPIHERCVNNIGSLCENYSGTVNHILALFNLYKYLDENGNDVRDLCRKCGKTIRKEERERILKLLKDPDVGLMCDEPDCKFCNNFRQALRKEEVSGE